MSDLKEEKPMLPINFRKNGMAYSLVLRKENRAIYREQVSENCYYFEVIIIRTKPESFFKGKSYPAREVYPTSEFWGQFGWTYRSIGKAMQKFNSLGQ